MRSSCCTRWYLTGSEDLRLRGLDALSRVHGGGAVRYRGECLGNGQRDALLTLVLELLFDVLTYVGLLSVSASDELVTEKLCADRGRTSPYNDMCKYHRDHGGQPYRLHRVRPDHRSRALAPLSVASPRSGGGALLGGTGGGRTGHSWTRLSSCRAPASSPRPCDARVPGGGLCKDDNTITFPQPICRDGDGWLALVDLPYGRKAADALKKHKGIAAALDIDEVQVFLDRIRSEGGSARRVALWVADVDVFAQKPPVTALAKVESVDFWQGFRFGQDARKRPIQLAMVWSSSHFPVVRGHEQRTQRLRDLGEIGDLGHGSKIVTTALRGHHRTGMRASCSSQSA
jgi:hypothetical protein